MAALIGSALLAGLMGSPHCLGMCGGFAASSGGWAWHLGRLLTYALLGVLVGSVGFVFPGPAWLPHVVAAVFLAWFALRLAGLVPELPFKAPWVAPMAKLAGRSRLLFGMVTGLLPCGLVYAATSLALAAEHPAWGAAVMLGFGLGTVPALALATQGLRRLAQARPNARRLLAAGVFALGMVGLFLRPPAPATASAAEAPPPCPMHAN